MRLEFKVECKYYGRNREYYKVFYSDKEYNNYKNWLTTARGYSNVKFLRKDIKTKDSINLDIKKKANNSKESLLFKLRAEKRPLKFRKFVYALLLKDEVVYVGQTSNLQSRIKQHTETKKFTSYAIIAIYPYNTSTKEMLEQESRYIGILKPRYNKTNKSIKLLT
jgi:hypothetical protein